MPLYTSLNNLLYVLVQIVNKVGLQKNADVYGLVVTLQHGERVLTFWNNTLLFQYQLGKQHCERHQKPYNSKLFTIYYYLNASAYTERNCKALSDLMKVWQMPSPV
jgi:hypothetical protein